ncbi:hypothetical protein M2459_001682 [Parabacteroides sp. PF5-5]|uniref:6-bladed beta-propeller n=1 Tax=unclassified Parabacteroides TaxID=2649774 RepID=UPI002473F1D9|nr:MULTISPECIES: 6-bladed beta-propeller [unclassified Parabacteroides]MDH6304945.1 hypothetical protein [Parabacteroides sp. PH5-39]MDH6315969.1 hypothetical protein [Parabacteroides sp. PF5-13]MDH6319626.1 hypothetical protein [Parabacteroides sp. PH5-13]MDH6323357.1 hypothetical protein [Parabacteroides sp. PH5-8]MDH6327134.1 hypothetical protein [Parabacteroides sp. PH5-41]
MKRTFLFLFVSMLAIYGKLGYELLTDEGQLQSALKGSLSDIAEQVTAIPLMPTGYGKMEKIRDIRREGDNIFLISGDVLYRFRYTGEFLGRITDPQKIRAATYVIDPVSRQLIVLGNVNDLFYYSFGGELLEQKKMGVDVHNQHIRSIAMYNHSIWTVEEHTQPDLATREICVEKKVVQYDTTFREISSYKLASAELSSKAPYASYLHLELGVTEDTGAVYAYSPILQTEKLLKDTLAIRNNGIYPVPLSYAEAINVYPLRFGRRYWFSSYHNPHDPDQTYTFCYDSDSGKSWQLSEGFKDNFYHTGPVCNLQPLDTFSNTYYYCKSGEEARMAFPTRSNSDNPVIFIVHLKG